MTAARSGLADRQFGGVFRPLRDDERNVSLSAALAAMPDGDPWVFTYGSLMWDRNCFAFAEHRPARLHGYHRAYCVWSVVACGTPDAPGLAFGLERGGSCRGIAYRVPRAAAPAQFDRLWRREMFTGCYDPRWVPVRIDDEPGMALTFLACREHPQYAGRLALPTIAHYVARAAGENGPCRDYLTNSLAHLRELGVRDRRLEALLELVERHG